MNKGSYKYGLAAVKGIVLYFAIWVMANDLLIMFPDMDVGVTIKFRDLVELFFPNNLLPSIVMGGVCLLLKFTPKCALSLWERIACCVGALLCLLGYSFEKTNYWTILYANSLCILSVAITFCGMALLLQLLLCWCKAGYWGLLKYAPSTKLEKVRLNPFYTAWAVIMLCWLPYIIIRYPAGIEYDAYHQIQQALGLETMTAHWPPFSSVLMGGGVWLGWKLFGSYTLGAFGFVLFQSVVCAGILAYSILVMKRMGVKWIWRCISTGIYAVVPVYANYLTAIVKDAMFSAMVVLFLTLLAEIVLLGGKRKYYVGMVISGLLMCMLRNNGIYIVVCMALAFGIYALVRKEKQYALMTALLAVVCILNMGYGHFLTSLGIPEASIREALSIPFQQTARYVRDCPQGVTEEEAQIIDAVLDYDNLATDYDPVLSDNVKGKYHGDTQALIDYFQVWFRQFLRHPSAYVCATLNNTYGWYSPLTRHVFFYATTWSDSAIQFEEPEALEAPKVALESYVRRFECIPGLMFLGNMACNVWATVYLFMAMLKKRDWQRGMLLLPSLLGILVCLASPTYTFNGIRYGLPVIYSIPFLVGMCMFRKTEENDKQAETGILEEKEPE